MPVPNESLARWRRNLTNSNFPFCLSVLPWPSFGYRTDRCLDKPPPFCGEPQNATAWAQELVFWRSLAEKERHSPESCSCHIGQERYSHNGKHPCQANCSKWIHRKENICFSRTTIPWEGSGATGASASHGEDWGRGRYILPQSSLATSLLTRWWTARWGPEGQSASHCNGRPGSGPPEEPEHMGPDKMHPRVLRELADHRITESQNSRGWKGPLWVI